MSPSPTRLTSTTAGGWPGQLLAATLSVLAGAEASLVAAVALGFAVFWFGGAPRGDIPEAGAPAVNVARPLVSPSAAPSLEGTNVAFFVFASEAEARHFRVALGDLLAPPFGVDAGRVEVRVVPDQAARQQLWDELLLARLFAINFSVYEMSSDAPPMHLAGPLPPAAAGLAP